MLSKNGDIALGLVLIHATPIKAILKEDAHQLPAKKQKTSI